MKDILLEQLRLSKVKLTPILIRHTIVVYVKLRFALMCSSFRVKPF